MRLYNKAKDKKITRTQVDKQKLAMWDDVVEALDTACKILGSSICGPYPAEEWQKVIDMAIICKKAKDLQCQI